MFNNLVLRVSSIFSFSIFYNLCFLDLIKNDSPEPWLIGFQDGASPGYTGIIELHDNIFFYLVVIAILVFWMLGSTIYFFNYDRSKITHKYLVHGTLIEILWTIFPAIVLLAIAIPSFRLLYILDEVTLPTITVKVTGHQWYWSYEYSDYETESGDPIEFDSYMIPDSDLEIGQTRLLEVDNPIILPENTHVRFIVSSTDVLHDFAVPAAGIKIDAAPGRLNQTSGYFEREGEFFGQCSELCGTYHGFMPIQIEVGSVEDYLSWISSLGGFFLFNHKNNKTSPSPYKFNSQNILFKLIGFISIFVLLSHCYFTLASPYFYFILFFSFFFILTQLYNNLYNIVARLAPSTTSFDKLATKKNGHFFLMCIETFFLLLALTYFLLLISNLLSYLFFTIYDWILGTNYLNIKQSSSYFVDGLSSSGATENNGVAADNNSNATHSTRTINYIDHPWSSTVRKEFLLNIFFWTLVISLLYYFWINVTFDDLYHLILSFVIFFIIFHFVLGKFSKNIFISIIQKYIILNIVLILISIIYGVILLPEIHCSGESYIYNNNKEHVKADLQVKEASF